MFYQGYKVSSNTTLQSHLLEGFMTHNLMVLLLGLCSQLAQAYLTIVSSIDDPMMRFTEFLLRATLFRNIVLNLEVTSSFHLGKSSIPHLGLLTNLLITLSTSAFLTTFLHYSCCAFYMGSGCG